MKDAIKRTVISIGMAMAVFCFAGVIFDIIWGGNFSLDNYGFTKMVAGCIIVGLGFGLPTVVYQKESLPTPIKIIIHMGIGCTVYTVVAYFVGWLGSSPSIGRGIAAAAIQLAIAFVIWILFMSYYQKEAKKMNEKLQEMK